MYAILPKKSPRRNRRALIRTVIYSPDMSLVADILESPASDFYRARVWNGAPPGTPIEDLPPLTRSLYATTPFLKRLYRTRGLLTKVAYLNEQPFLVGRHLEDIASESYGTLGTRPLVAFGSTHESLEKSLWCYSRNVLPLVTNDDPDITAMLAKRYEADTLITDTATLAALLPALARYYGLAHFRFVSVIDSSFNLPLLEKMFPGAKLSLVLGLPETGGVAHACPEALGEKRLAFHASPHRRIERGDELVVTDDRLLPTPLVRYRTGIRVRFQEPVCSCGANESFELAPAA